MLEIKNLNKSFGSLQAVKDLNLQVEPGKILGMIGQNGAGKTTTFRLILKFLTPDSGEVLWNGQAIHEGMYNEVGYLPEERGLYPKVTIEEQILYFAKLRGKTKKEILPKIDEWLERFQVKGKRTDKIKSLSKGNQQKVQLITTLIHEPKLVILDEPFSGLDPVNASLLKQAILDLKAQGACVIFSSHNMENVEELCDSLVMIRNGETVLNGTIEAIRDSFGRTKLYLDEAVDIEAVKQVAGVLSVEHLKNRQYLVKLADSAVGKEVFEVVTKDGYLQVFNQQAPTLEEIFKEKAGESHE